MTGQLDHLLSGTDIRGVASRTEAAEPTLTEEIGRRIGVGFAQWLSEAAGKRCAELCVAVGHDSRVTGPALALAVLEGMRHAGCRVLSCGLCTTPAMFMSTILLACDGAVMVTASHLPWQRNGYKFFTRQGGLEQRDISAILEIASNTHPPERSEEPVEAVDFLPTYTGHLRQLITAALGEVEPLAGLRIVVDAGNGAGGFYADMLAGLGADTAGSQFLKPDGYFPNHIPNPEDAEAMRSISGAVLATGADIGVIFDADCDRAAMVDAQGRAINRNRLIALVSAMLLNESKNITVVTDSVTSAGLEKFIRAHGGVQHRYMRGYRNVIDEAKRLNAEGIDCPLAMETSGHAALRENFFLDDGMYLMTRMIIEARRLQKQRRQLSDLLDGLEEPAEEVELRLAIHAEDFRAAGQAALLSLEAQVASRGGLCIDRENREGLRIQFFGSPENWTLLRLSLHDPQVVINAEAQAPGGVADMLRVLLELLQSTQGIDLTTLQQRLG